MAFDTLCNSRMPKLQHVPSLLSIIPYKCFSLHSIAERELHSTQFRLGFNGFTWWRFLKKLDACNGEDTVFMCNLCMTMFSILLICHHNEANECLLISARFYIRCIRQTIANKIATSAKHDLHFKNSVHRMNNSNEPNKWNSGHNFHLRSLSRGSFAYVSWVDSVFAWWNSVYLHSITFFRKLINGDAETIIHFASGTNISMKYTTTITFTC